MTATATTNIDERRWQAVVGRDPSADGTFVLAVRTTGIYCRPSCGAKRPRRENVVFFTTPADAERAGFRACLRCHPRSAVRWDRELIERVRRRLDAAGGVAPTLAALSAEFGVSPFHLQRTFKRIVGVSPRQYVEARRVERVKFRLRSGDGIAAAIYNAGCSSGSGLYGRAGARLGMTPGRYRRGGEGMRIVYTIAPCRLGRILVGATERGVSAVSLGDDDATLEAALREEYPSAEIRRDDASIRRWVEAVLRMVEGEAGRSVPIDVRASSFRLQVWQALHRIPRGATRTYGEIAQAIGRPSAVRAVARACATNPVSVVVPCHRAVRADGSPGGYRWGLGRKRALLERERVAAKTRGRAH